MKIHKYFFTLLCVLSLLYISCEKFLDVNEPPGSPGNVAITETAVLPSLLANWYGDNWEQVDIVRFWILQNVTDGTGVWTERALQPRVYSVQFQWNFLGCLKDAIDVRRLAIENGNKNYQGIAEALMAWGWASITDYFGNIPYTEAFRFPEIKHPHYDEQQLIYSGIEELVDDAISNLSDNSSQKKPSNDDLVNHGDISKWLKFAYGLKARYAMRLSYAPGKTKMGQAQIAINALANSLASNADNIDFEHYDETGSRGWVYESQRLSDFSHTPSVYLIDLLKNLNDPRLERIFDPAYTGEYYGWISGTSSVVGEYPCRFSRSKYLKSDGPSILMSFSECKFLEAEAQLFVGDLSSAQAAFEEGIEADLQRLGIDQNDIDDYIATFTLPNDEELAQEMIITQKYLANFMGTPEPVFDHLRTGYPAFDYKSSIDNIHDLTCPRKIPYPEMEKRENPNCPGYTGTPQSPHNRVWWDTKVVITK